MQKAMLTRLFALVTVSVLLAGYGHVYTEIKRLERLEASMYCFAPRQFLPMRHP